MEENFSMEWNMEENFSMEWNMEENFSMEWKIFSMDWNGNGMEENFKYGIWKNRLPYHALPLTTKAKQIKSIE